MAEHNEIGKIGENIAVKFLQDKGFNIIDRNFHVKGGEIDIIATKNSPNFHVKLDNIYFVEVKSKKVNSFNDIKDMSFRPENNLTLTKRRRILKAIKFYLNKNKIVESDINICVLAVIVFLEEKSKKAKVKIYENMPLY